MPLITHIARCYYLLLYVILAMFLLYDMFVSDLLVFSGLSNILCTFQNVAYTLFEVVLIHTYVVFDTFC